jgi:hypothetical protein
MGEGWLCHHNKGGAMSCPTYNWENIWGFVPHIVEIFPSLYFKRKSVGNIFPLTLCSIALKDMHIDRNHCIEIKYTK